MSKKFLVLLSCLFSVNAFASGTPVVYCNADNQDVQLYFQLSRTDEDLGDVMQGNGQDDQFATLGEDDPKNPSVLVTPKSANYAGDEDKAFAKIALPKGTAGFASSVAVSKKQTLDTFVLDAVSKQVVVKIVATNKADCLNEKAAQSAMKGLMTLKAVKLNGEPLVLKSVPVSCTYSWE